ncbi:hypothetical protein LY76DRAFT_383605 [Colletotrichum caudatum]|nr:hypothetical protein LY76DRAFT_383605 [Colletotrichum caudatum]
MPPSALSSSSPAGSTLSQPTALDALPRAQCSCGLGSQCAKLLRRLVEVCLFLSFFYSFPPLRAGAAARVSVTVTVAVGVAGGGEQTILKRRYARS